MIYSCQHFLDGAFLDGLAFRQHNLEAEVKAKPKSGLVTVDLTHVLRHLALLPDEARQLADSLVEAAETAEAAEE